MYWRINVEALQEKDDHGVEVNKEIKYEIPC